ncbi:hypothetical protein RV18_GL002480 [Enterococcus termitis]|nr:hypothetical protein RV18_GL002480 [Enterococcus termitis]
MRQRASQSQFPNFLQDSAICSAISRYPAAQASLSGKR